MRRHPIFGDTVMALVLGLLTLAEFSDPFAQQRPSAFLLVGALLVLPVVFRRWRPVLAAYLILAGGVLQLLTHGGYSDHVAEPVRTADLALGIALYTLVVYVSRRQATIYAGLLAVGIAVDLVWRISQVAPAVVLGIGSVAIFGFSWVLGEFIGARRAYHAEVERRLDLLETERDQQATIAVAAERTRIARELHDVVAHAVSVIVVQADGAGYAIRTHPDLAENAVRTISETGREALVELRRLLDVLRSDDEPGGLAPQPDVAALPDLAEKVTAIGLPVVLTLRGDVSGLPAAVGLGIYRIVQESLTNALKHAGPDATATVRVERVGGLVEVEVGDDGHGPAARGAQRELVRVSGGNGLIGMRERASVLGGTLAAGRGPGGGWRVRATFPIRSHGDTKSH